MRKIIVLLTLMTALAGIARERSYTISFGAPTASTSPLTNDTYMSAVSAGAEYIDHVTSVVAVFPETDAIRMSSQKTNGKFNIHLADKAQVVASKIVVEACRYDNDRDLEAALLLNSEYLYITSPEYGYYTLSIPSRPEKLLTNIIIDAEHRVYIKAISVYYDDAQGSVEPEMQTVATPVITPSGGSVTAGTEVSISCSTPGAEIYYTVDGDDPSTSSLHYEAPVAVHNSLGIRAFAVKDGMKPSEVAIANFTVRNPDAELVSVFNFAEPETLNPAVAAPAQKESVLLDGRTFSDGNVALTFRASETGNTHVRLYGSYDAGTDLRLYDNDIVTISSLNPAYSIAAISVTISTSGSDSDAWFIASQGEWTWETDSWAPGDERVTSVDLASYMQSRITSMTVTLTHDVSAGLEAVIGGEPSRVRYFNMQGMPVCNPEPGHIYIRLSDSRVDKVIVK